VCHCGLGRRFGFIRSRREEEQHTPAPADPHTQRKLQDTSTGCKNLFTMMWLVLVAIFGIAYANESGDVDCTNCEFSVGGIGYLEGPNCRQFYQCRMKPGGWIEHVLLCCPEGTRWNQEIKNCDWGHCNVGFDGCPNATSDGDECNFWPDENNQTFFFVHPMWAHQMCPAGTVYKHEICGCDHGCKYPSMMKFQDVITKIFP
jgi:hypothetical protein